MDIAEITSPYRLAQVAALAMGFLFALQTVVNMILRMRAGQSGGVPIEGGPDRLLYRVDRARSNSFEVMGFFCIALLVAISLGAPAAMVNVGALVFLVARVLHMAMYYADLVRLRSVCFLAGNVGVVVILFASVRALL